MVRRQNHDDCPPRSRALLRSKQAHDRYVPIKSLLFDYGKAAIASLITVASEAAAISVIHPPGKPSSLIAHLPRMPVMAFGNACLGVWISG
jgi:hypothetical protein